MLAEAQFNRQTSTASFWYGQVRALPAGCCTITQFTPYFACNL
jgi:hypothetical protein